MHFSIPGQQPFDIKTVILDLNGTIAIDGKLIPGVKERLAELRNVYRLVLFTGDTQGNGKAIADELELEMRKTPDARAKADEAKTLEPETCATIGNGRIDLELFRTVRLRLAVIQQEGAHGPLLLESDAVFTSVLDAIDFLLQKNRHVATLRS